MRHGKRDGHPALGCLIPIHRRGVQPCLYSSYTSSSRVWLSVTLAALGTAVAPTLCHRLPPGSCPPHSANCSHNTAPQFLLPLPGPPCHTRPVGSPHFFRDSPVLALPSESQFTTSYLLFLLETSAQAHGSAPTPEVLRTRPNHM